MPTLTERTALPEHNLDMLRAIAVLLVLANHLLVSLGSSARFGVWLGQAGVLAFFVHTTLVLMASIERDGERPDWVRRFYVRRAWRIYPLAVIVILAAVITREPRMLPPMVSEDRSLWLVLSNLALMQNLTGHQNVLIVLWTLPLEVQMYALLPVCYRAARSSRVWPMLGMLAIGAIGAAVYHFAALTTRLRLFEYVPCFLMGVVAYRLLRRRRAPVLPAWSWPAIIFADIAVSGLAWAAWGHGWFVIVGFCAVLGLPLPLVRDTAAFTRTAHTVATYSFGIYLLHTPALQFGFGVLHAAPIAVRVLASGGALWLGCYVAYRFIEAPGIAIGRRVLSPSVPASVPEAMAVR